MQTVFISFTYKYRHNDYYCSQIHLIYWKHYIIILFWKINYNLITLIIKTLTTSGQMPWAVFSLEHSKMLQQVQPSLIHFPTLIKSRCDAKWFLRAWSEAPVCMLHIPSWYNEHIRRDTQRGQRAGLQHWRAGMGMTRTAEAQCVTFITDTDPKQRSLLYKRWQEETHWTSWAELTCRELVFPCCLR